MKCFDSKTVFSVRHNIMDPYVKMKKCGETEARLIDYKGQSLKLHALV